MLKALPFIRQPYRVTRRVSDVSAAGWRYRTHVKKNDIDLLIYCYGFSQCRKYLYNTIDYMIKGSYSFSHSADSSNVDSNVSSAYQPSLGDIVDQSRDFLGSIALRWKFNHFEKVYFDDLLQ